MLYFEFIDLARSEILDYLESLWYEHYDPSNYFFLLTEMNPLERLELLGS